MKRQGSPSVPWDAATPAWVEDRIMIETVRRSSRRRTWSETAEAWLIFSLSFPVCLVAATVKRLAAGQLNGTRLSIVAEARAEASFCSSAAFMG